MKIKRIKKLNNFGVFRNFAWEDEPELQDFGRFNLIYGWNGTGKSTISRLLRDLELRQSIREGEAILDLSDQAVEGSEFGQISPDTIALKVFNREFIQDNVFTQDDNIEPIIVLGKESVDAEKKISELNNNLINLKTLIDNSDAQIKKLIGMRDTHSQSNAKTLKDRIGNEASSDYRNYNRSHYEVAAKKLIDGGDAKAFILDENKRFNLSRLQGENRKARVDLPDYVPFNLSALEARVTQLLSQTVASRTVQALVDDPSLANWIREGLTIHEDRSTDSCLYCNRAMPPDRLHALQQHFDDSYNAFVCELDVAMANCEVEVGKIDALCSSLPVPAQLYADLEASYDQARENLINEFKLLKSRLVQLRGALNEKKERVFDLLSLDCKVSLDAQNDLDALIDVIKKHNDVCDSFDEKVTKARESLEHDFVASKLDEYRDLMEKIGCAEKKRSNDSKRADQIRNEIAKLQQQVLDHGSAAEELNADLYNYLGHGSLQLEVRERGYRLVRNGRPAHDPSEGEITAIALLYFLKTLYSHDFDLHEGIVVLDDPVSSLDDNALFMASSYIRRRTQNAGQLFVLTHNLAFFHEMRDWFQKQPGQGGGNLASRPARFYMLRSRAESGVRHSRICVLDRLLQEYASEYQYLFASIYYTVNNDSSEMEDTYPLPNMARRLLETFLSFKRPSGKNQWEKLEDLDFKPEKKTQIFRFVNVYSHGNLFGGLQHDPTISSEAQSALRNLLELIETVDKQHYDGMVDLIRNSNQN